MSFLVAKEINGKTSMRLLRVLFDSGGSSTWIHAKALPNGCTPTRCSNPLRSQTIAGTFESDKFVQLLEITLPEFDRNKKIESQGAFVFDGNSAYDLILGRDFLEKVGIKIDFNNTIIQWLGTTVKMKDESSRTIVAESDWESTLEEPFSDSLANTILDAKYDAWTPEQVGEAQTHLTPSQRNDIKNLVASFPKLFSGELGQYPHRKVHLELDPNARPVHARPYSVPHSHRDVFKKELKHLVDIGVLRPCGATDWAAPTFIIPKKDGRVRWVSDFRELNKVIKRRVYPLPRINDILQRRTGYKFFSKLDISMMFYAFELDEETKELCTIVTPFGKYQYCRLPMGIKCSPDIAQEHIEETLRGIDCECFIDDIGAFSGNWADHLTLLKTILQALSDAGFTINPLKCEWGVQETDFLGYWFTPVGLKPWSKKVDAILAMQPPQNIKQLRSFIGAVNFYRDLWPRRSHVLAPLSDLTGKGKFVWTDVHQKAFEEMKAVMAEDALMHYPDHNLPFEIYTDASDYQLGACIMQNGNPVAYYSKKLTDAQINYTTMEKELLAIVMTLKEYRSTLLGARITIYTDHKNLTFKNLNSSRVLRWRLFLEDYDLTFNYIEGKNNVLGDVFSRLPRMDLSTEGQQSPPVEESLFFSFVDDPKLLDCFLNLPPQQQMRNPVEIRWLQENQFEDQQLNQARVDNPLRFPSKNVMGYNLIHWRNDHLDNDEMNWKIAIPSPLLNDIILWFHSVLGHAGETRVYDTIRTRYHHPRLKSQVEVLIKSCDTCRLYKLSGPGAGELPERDIDATPWQEVHVDLIGPWKVEVNELEVEFNALTCIDPVSNLTELIRIENKTADHIARKFEQCWLARYPWPEVCVHDNGNEFVGWEFQQLLEQCAIRDRPTTSRNPQSNAICERMHQTVGNILRTIIHGEPVTAATAPAIVDEALATAMHALRAAVSRSLGNHSPGEIAFHRNMFLNLPIIADLQALQDKRQEIVQKNLARANQRRIRHDYQPGQRIAVKETTSKLGPRTEGPFRIHTVHTNGTVTIIRRPGVLERINIRRILPLQD